MENSNVFTYQYSAKQNREVERIRRKYLPREEDKMETLRKLDAKVQMAGTLPSLCIGVMGCLIFGIGMCFGRDVFEGADWLTLLFCIPGVITMLPAYPVYKHISKKTKAELTPEILRLSEEIINQ
ncbi:MAG: hypothetical protein IJX62_03130 [Clostridia bacterium]|nr:hypothetical protein [Clostridia bacterium]